MYDRKTYFPLFQTGNQEKISEENCSLALTETDKGHKKMAEELNFATVIIEKRTMPFGGIG